MPVQAAMENSEAFCLCSTYTSYTYIYIYTYTYIYIYTHVYIYIYVIWLSCFSGFDVDCLQCSAAVWRRVGPRGGGVQQLR